jgi:polyisoprenoid-binding protein YceI
MSASDTAAPDTTPARKRRIPRWARWVIGAAVVLLAAAVIAPLILAALNRAPEDFVSSRALGDGTVAAADLEGRWEVAGDSAVGYRVGERIGLASLEAVGRTDAVTGSFDVADGVLTDAEFVVDMTTFTSDRSQRDDQFNGRIMDVENFPESRFVLTEPVTVPESTDVASMDPFVVAGELTLRGTTRPVSFDLYAATDEGRLRLTGQTVIVFSEWGIPNPSLPAAMIFTDSDGVLEFDLVLAPA